MTAPDEISKFIALLFKTGDVVELRVPKAGRSKTISGYFSDHEKLAEAVRRLSKNPALPGIYWTINPCVPACLARSPEAWKPYAATTTSSSEIVRRRWLPIDCDAKRIPDVSSTDEEKAAAGDVASRIRKYLHEEGFRGLLLADSGNGWHILIPIDLPNDEVSTALCSRFLSALAEKFDTDKAHVDKKLYDANRILKAYGTMARKGSNTRERPHRMSRIVSGGPHAPVARELLEKIAASVKAPPKEEKQSNDTAAKMEEFLDWANIQHGPRMDYRDGFKWQVTCPFDEAHRSPDAVVYQLPNGAMAFRCSHNSCVGRIWSQFRELVEGRKGAKFQFNNSKSAAEAASKRDGGNPWSRAEGMDVFLKGEEDPVDYLHFPVIVRGAVTNIFSPRGAGKSIWTLGVAVLLAMKKTKVLLIDRDNPRREIKARLRSFGATSKLPFLKVIAREHAPSLTDARAWAEFPYSDYDLVIVDALDSAAEGIGEQDSAKPSKAIAPLLDIAHRENGPAVLVLGNCVRTGAHSRGSGVIEDRADIVFEVRDCTNFHPIGPKPWWEELPPAAAADWASRSSRRKKQEKQRLAFIPSKFRVGEEPEPFIEELNLADEPWTVRNVTDEVDLEGKAQRERLEKEAAERSEDAKTALLEEVNRRVGALEPPLYKERDAIPLLRKKGLTRKQSRQVIEAGDGFKWRLIPLAGVPGPPVGVLPLGYDFFANRGYIKVSGGEDTPTQNPAKNALFEYSPLRRPHPENAAEIPPSQPIDNTGATTPPISAAGSIYTGGGATKPGTEDDL